MDDKQRIRMEVWRKMEEYEIAIYPRPCFGKIPNFVGSVAAARRVARMPFFNRARVIYFNPEAPQKPLREMALRRGKTLVLATPGLRRGFLVLRPDSVNPGNIPYAATLRGAIALGERVPVLEDVRIDLFVVGSVAVAPDGGRLGKGNGFSDLEYAVLRELGVLDSTTPVVTTVHDVQVVERVPMSRHDVPVDYIATPSRLIKAEQSYAKPSGVFWDDLPVEIISSIPILKRLAGI